jgi:alpha-ketoglutarate-dependent taurine dioxygenase
MQLKSDDRSENRFRQSSRKALFVSSESLVTTSYLDPDHRLPLVIRPSLEGVNLIEWAARNRDLIEARLIREGGLLFRGFAIDEVEKFEGLMRALCGDLLDYTYRSTPRTQIRGGIYTSTEYPADQTIPLHNEMSYSNNWPMKIGFYCFDPGEQGGETPIADSRKVFQRLDAEIRDRFATLGVMYVRNYNSKLDLSWQDVFQTSHPSEVEDYCRQAAMTCEFRENNLIKTSQVCQAVAAHPLTGEPVWFNQAHLFHISSLNESTRRSLITVMDEERVPRNAYYGDGSPIELSTLTAIREAYQSEACMFSWQRGDILLLDNMLVAHGRMPYQGQRKIFVAMAQSAHL